MSQKPITRPKCPVKLYRTTSLSFVSSVRKSVRTINVVLALLQQNKKDDNKSHHPFYLDLDVRFNTPNSPNRRIA